MTLPVVYVYLPDLTVTAAEISYTWLGGGAIELKSPVAETTVVDDDEVHRRLSGPGRADLITAPARTGRGEFLAPVPRRGRS